jgi:Membrane protein involved in the export of O-antigen and teichoic acid
VSETTSNSTGQKIIRNAFYGFTSWILPLFLSFFATRLLVKALGHSEYGIYTLVTGFLGYSFTFNVGRAVTKYVAEYAAGNEREKIKNIISATAFVNLLIGAAGVLTLILLAEWLVADVLNIEEDARAKTVIALYIAAVSIFFVMCGQVFSAAVQGLHRFDIYSKIVNLNSFTMLLGNIFLAWSGYGLLSLFVWNLIVTILSFLIFFVTAKRLLPEISVFHRFDRNSLRLVFGYSAGVVGYQILSNLLLLFERSWITRSLGTESLTFYVVPMTISFQIHYFITSFILVIFPLASELQNNPERLEKLYTKATKIVLVLVAYICATLVIQSEMFLTLWLGADFAANSAAVMKVHVISYSLIAVIGISWQMTEGLGHPNFNCLIFMVCLIFTVPLMIFLGEEYGNLGVAVGRLAGFAVLFLFIFYIERWFFKKVLTRFWTVISLKLAVAVAAAAVVEYLVIKFLPGGWVTLAVSVASGGAVYLLVLLSLGLLAEDEKTLLRRLLKI